MSFQKPLSCHKGSTRVNHGALGQQQVGMRIGVQRFTMAVAADGHAAMSEAASVSSAASYSSSFSNLPLAAAFISFFTAQFLKIITTWYKEKRWDLKRLAGSGGMPSSHTATVVGLAVAIGLKDGTGGSLFAIAMVLASIVMYDASSVRFHAGRQAEVLNQIVFELPAEHPLADSRPLREPLGHTPPQVAAGAVLGCIIAYVLYLISLLGA